MTESTVAEHIIFVTAFLGYILFVLMAGVGLVSLPWDMFVDYLARPRPIDDGNFEIN